MNSFGKIFRISIFGESHGPSVGILIDGCPAGIPVCVKDFEKDLSKRKAGKKGTTPRIEDDKPRILSGVFNDKTSGSPINLTFDNNNTRSGDYAATKDIPRPGHSDFTALKKYQGFNDYRGGGHFSGRITLGIVAAGVLAKKILQNVEFSTVLLEAGGNPNIDESINQALEEGDSIGGLIKCEIKNLPIGLGEPFFDKVESRIAQIIFAIPATKGLEFGSGFESAKMKGSKHNDIILNKDGETATNNSGGANGGLTNGNPFVFRVAVKPTSSIHKAQKSFSVKAEKLEMLNVKGRHDACIALRMPVIIEAAAAIVLADLLLVNKAKAL
ncbi:MAG: chorismate synthase [Bacteroidales bacterium]|nr:chorismate synthase [Bacteroidales bacterium]